MKPQSTVIALRVVVLEPKANRSAHALEGIDMTAISAHSRRPTTLDVSMLRNSPVASAAVSTGVLLRISANLTGWFGWK
jgi:hypothetical protein